MKNTTYPISTICEKIASSNELFKFIDVTTLKAHDGHAILKLQATPTLGQGGGLLAGGIIASLADEAMAFAAICAVEKIVVTSEMNVRFLRSTKPEGAVYAEARVIRAGRNIVTVEAHIYKDKENPLAIAGGSFFIIKPSDE